MSESKLYSIEIGGDVATMRRLVRCKECRYAYEHHDARGRWLLCDLHTYFHVRPEDFCSRGETEEDEHDTD